MRPSARVALTLIGIAGLMRPSSVSAQQPPHPTASVQDHFIQWPLPAGAEQYRDIDGHKMHTYVVEQAQISRRYRDAGHPKFWGRIIGTSGDAESATWLSNHFERIGLSDVRIQSLDLAPQWFPKEGFSVVARAGGKTLELTTAQPDYRAVGTPVGGLDVEAVYVGMGRESDYQGRDVRGKAVFVYSMIGMPDIWEQEKTKRATEKGAAAIFNVHMLPGSMKYEEYPMPTPVPSFSVGGDEGLALEKMFAAGPVRVSVKLDTELVPNLKTALVWGTLPGASDETIYVIAHRDGWFDAAGDNAGGVASMIGLAEHYAKIPRAQRPRTMVFIGLDGHHNSGEGSGVGGRWLTDNRATLFAKTALLINDEHPSTALTMVRPRYTDLSGGAPEMTYWTTGFLPQQWYAGGPSRPELQKIAVDAFREFGVTTQIDPLPRPPAGDGGRHVRYVPVVATSEFWDYFHTDLETPETVPWTGLEASTRAYARIIDEVNKHPLSMFKRPEEPAPPPN